MITEVERVCDQLARLGVPARFQIWGTPAPTDVAPAVLVAEDQFSTATITDPTGAHVVHVDAMTAYSVLADLPDNIGLDAVWAELVEIDHGE